MTEAERAEVEELKETIRQLRAIPAPTTFRGLHLMPREKHVLHLLRNGWLHSTEEIAARLGTSHGVVSVLIWRLRKKSTPLGIAIVTHWGEGYSMSRELIAALAELENK